MVVAHESGRRSDRRGRRVRGGVCRVPYRRTLGAGVDRTRHRQCRDGHRGVGARIVVEHIERRCAGTPRRMVRSGEVVSAALWVCSTTVAHALAEKKPIVALETTLVTHGLPLPDGLETALALEDEVRGCSAIPATV